MNIILEKDKYGGAFYKVSMPEKNCLFDIAADEVCDFEAFCCSYRKQPFFMDATAGTSIAEIPKETQWLGIKHKGGTYSVYLSITEGMFRTSFYGEDNKIKVVALTGDSTATDDSFYAFYKISGDNFYALMEAAGKSVSEKLKTVSLKKDKEIPEFIDYFGWCTWDSFYTAVTHQDIEKGLKSFEMGGFVPKFLILDDGWQTVNKDVTDNQGQQKLVSFKANPQFDGSLAKTVKMAKEVFGVEKFFVWHAVIGYWGGVDTTSEEMKKYSPRLSTALHTDGLKENNPARWESEQFPFGIIDENKAFDFYNDYHTYLKNEGVDGVKVDVQSSMEAHAEGRGGRVYLTNMLRTGLETSVCQNFNGNIINCMSHANDILYNSKCTNVMRSSDDFFPSRAESHSAHIYTNAVNSIWLGQFTVCDWDMFQTQHEFAYFHAAARALSGGPVYVSDKVDEHNFELIKTLTTDDDKVLRARDAGMPTEDCLFENPVKSHNPYKIFNSNNYSSTVGVFAFDENAKFIEVTVSDIQKKEKHACYSFMNKEFFILNKEDAYSVEVSGKEFDIITLSPINDGFAVIGITDKLNPGAAISKVEYDDNTVIVDVITSGNLAIYSEKEIAGIYAEGKETTFTNKNGFAEVMVPEGVRQITIKTS